MIISGQHDRFEPHVLKPTDVFGSLGLERIGDRDQPDDPPVDHNIERRLALAREALAVFQQAVRLHAALGEESPAANQNQLSLQTSFDAVSGQGYKRLDRPERHTLGLGVLDNGLSQRMLAVPFRTRGHAQDLCAAQPYPLGQRLGRNNLGHRRFSSRQGAGFIKDHGGQRMRPLQYLSAFDEYAIFGPTPGADHDGGRSSQAQRTRTGNNQHGHKGHQGKSEGRVRSEHQPETKRDNGSRNNCRHKVGRNRVRQALNWCF